MGAGKKADDTLVDVVAGPRFECGWISHLDRGPDRAQCFVQRLGGGGGDDDASAEFWPPSECTFQDASAFRDKQAMATEEFAIANGQAPVQRWGWGRLAQNAVTVVDLWA